MSIQPLTRALRQRPGLGPFLGALLTWTLLWTVLGVEDVATGTALGRGAIGSGLDAHEVMEAAFVAAYTGVRWAAGAVILVAGALVVRWGMRRDPKRG